MWNLDVLVLLSHLLWGGGTDNLRWRPPFSVGTFLGPPSWLQCDFYSGVLQGGRWPWELARPMWTSTWLFARGHICVCALLCINKYGKERCWIKIATVILVFVHVIIAQTEVVE